MNEYNTKMLNSIESKKILKIINDYQKTLGNKTRISILIVIRIHQIWHKKSPNKRRIYDFLNALGYKISYKNVLWNLDKLHTEKIISFKKIKKRNNMVLVSINIENIKKILEENQIMYKRLLELFKIRR